MLTTAGAIAVAYLFIGVAIALLTERYWEPDNLNPDWFIVVAAWPALVTLVALLFIGIVWPLADVAEN